jgi:hypothetical protein
VRIGALLSGVLGLVLLGLCVAQWNGHTGSTLVEGWTDYHQRDMAGMAALNRESNVNDTARTGIEGLIGLFWLGVGVYLWRKDAAAKLGERPYGRMPRR